MLLSGDIGGTHIRLALIERRGDGAFSFARRERYHSRDFACFEDVLTAFAPPPGIPAAFAVAGPVVGGEAQVTNLPWRLDAQTLARRFSFAPCLLLNDLEAVAWGLTALPESAFVTLQAGHAQAQGHQAVIAAGTGLGEAGLFWDGRRHRPFACEGGHASFAPRDAREWALFEALRKRHGHVSWERVVSGMGIPILYAHLCREAGVLPGIDPDHPQAAVWIGRQAEAGDLRSIEALHWFASLYGAEAGNLALKLMSRGGMFVAGGIAPKILPFLTDGGFVAAFRAKGRMQPLLEAMPVRIVCDEDVALYGLAQAVAEGTIV